MADEEQPPPRKVGSLRDRIAQFEKKPEASAPPPPRAAPKQWAWKAKQETTATASPAPNTSTTSAEKPTPSTHERSPSPPPQRPAFSSDDAREAIAGGMGSLKERMAALQGRNIGGMAPPPKPKKVVIEREEPKEEDQPEPVEDEDEEEKARRARLAERMAKLGGARVGVGPPLFSRPQKHEEDESKAVEDKHPEAGDDVPGEPKEEPKATVVENEPEPDAEATDEAKPATSDEPHVASTDEPKSPSNEPKPAPSDEGKPTTDESKGVSPSITEPTPSVASPESKPPVTSPEPAVVTSPDPITSRSPPTSMPIPAAPKRAAPPRKKAPRKTVEESKPEPDSAIPEEDVKATELEDKADEGAKTEPEVEDKPAPDEDKSTPSVEDKPTPEVESKPKREPKAEPTEPKEEPTGADFSQAEDIGMAPVPIKRAPTPPAERVKTPPVERAPTPPVARGPTRAPTPPIQRVQTPPVERVPTPPAAPFSPAPVHPGVLSPIVRPGSPIPRPESPGLVPRPESPVPVPRPESPLAQPGKSVLRPESPEPEVVTSRPASPAPAHPASPVPVRAASPVPVRSVSSVPVRSASPLPVRSASPVPARPESPAARSRSPSLPPRPVSPIAARALSPRPVSPTTLPSSPPVRRAGARRASLLRSEVPLSELRKEAEKERQESEEPESEETKKANLAARMAKLGGVSMFGPQRRSSIDVERRASMEYERRASTDIDRRSSLEGRKEPFPSIPTEEEVAELKRRDSMESLTGMHTEEPQAVPRDEHEPFSPQSRASSSPLMRGSLGSVGRRSSLDAGSTRKSSGEANIPGSEVQPPPQRSPSIRRSIPPPAVPEEQPSPIEESAPLSPRPNLPPPPPPEFVAPPPPPGVSSPPGPPTFSPPPPPVSSPPASEPFVAPPPPPPVHAPPSRPSGSPPPPPRPSNAPPPPPPTQEEEEEPVDAVSPAPPPMPSSPPVSPTPWLPSSPPPPVPTSRPSRRPSIPIPGRDSDYTSPARSPVDHSRAAQFVGLAQPEGGSSSKSEMAQVEAAPTNEEGEAETEEQARRRTIAQRMAKLGGIKFGMPGVAPPPVPRRQPTNPPEEDDNNEPAESAPTLDSAPVSVPVAEEAQLVDDGSEESERARKERIAAKMAAMGGMRFGMLPPGAGGPLGRPPPPPSTAPPPPPTAVPPPVPSVTPPRPPSSAPPPVPTKAKSPERGASEADDFATISEGQSLEEEGVHVEAEVSEPEQLGMPEEEDEPTPPPPPRPANRPPPAPRAMSPPSRNPPPAPGSRQNSFDVGASQPQGFTMVEAPGDDSDADGPPPPPRPATRPPPPPSSRPPPPPPEESDFEHAGVDDYMTRSLVSEDETNYPTGQEAPARTSRELPIPPRPTAIRLTAAPPPGYEPDSDMLMVLWGKIGVQVTQSAIALAEKGKKSIVGDGTGAGFVTAVLAGVDTAYKSSYGWLVFAQSGGKVQRRSSDIMPGDIVVMTDVKLKGHKGLQAYSTHVSGELVGVVSEFEAKKHKIKVWQPALQPNTYPTVESVSYRLEDLKSGTIQVYRVAENI
ncbi:unnamed protein product [Rhizoctonia solani]|uniref:BBC1/AIM3 cysteine proteinase-fold domain-containing protein n=1 Tax=Rhizoctonia solani TaxID=456999 RepID=A0A8H3C3G8_9AGAM|nr:unnamed protein product [Rhizoctonia solani]